MVTEARFCEGGMGKGKGGWDGGDWGKHLGGKKRRQAARFKWCRRSERERWRVTTAGASWIRRVLAAPPPCRRFRKGSFRLV